jgi:MFS family permease
MEEHPGSPRGIMFLIVGAGVVTTARAMSMIFLAIELQRKFGLGLAAIGFLLGIGPLLGAAIAPFAGSMSDRVGRRPLLVLTLMAMALAVIVIGLAGSVWLFCLAQTCAAISIAVYGPLSRALISDISPEPLRLKYFSWRYTASNVGWTVGPMMGVAAGLAPTVLFVGAGVIYAILALALHLVHLPDLRSRHRIQWSMTMPLFTSIKLAIADPRMTCFVAGGTLLVAVYGQWSATLAPYLSANIVDGAEIFAYLVSINGAVVLFGNQVARKLIERVGALHALVIGCAMFAASQFGFMYSSGWMGFAISMIVFTIGEILVVPSEYMLVDSISDESNRGSYYGAYALSSAGSFLGPALGGLTSDILGTPAMFTLFAGFAVASAILYMVGSRRPARFDR